MRALPFSAVIILALGATAIAQPAGRNPKREAEIEGQLLAIAPAAVPPFRQATRFMDRGDYAAAVPLFRDAMAHAPRFTPILRRLGGALVVTGRKDEGLNLLEQALAAERSPENLISLAQRLAYPRPREQGTPAERERALALATEASDGYQGSDDPSYLTLVAYVAISLDRVPEFKGAVTELKRKYPAETVTHYLAAVMAATDADWISAEREAKAAGRLGMPPEAVEGFLSSGVRTRATIKKVEYGTIYLMLAWAGGLVLLFLAGVALSRATLRSIERSDPNVSASPPERFLRGVYRALVGVSAAYYYLSLPFVAVLVLGAAAAFTYGFILLGHIPIKLVILIGVAALITVWKMVQSLLLRIPPSDPGRQLTEAEAPRLFELAREVAERVGTRPIDEIRVTPGTDLAVYERGTTRHRAVEGEQRVLVLGVATLNDFRRSPFRAVLAHEYGHFSHRDTAGGALALRVRQDMTKFAIAMAQQGQAVWWNLAFVFLRIYHFVFRRISHGATRLQEVLADRVAARLYGPKSFEEGLRHVIRRSVEFDVTAGRELQAATEGRRTCRNLYSLSTLPADHIEERVQEALARHTTEDDTHPSPTFRFYLVSEVRSDQGTTESGMVWDLFIHPESLKAEMTAAVDAAVKEAAAVAGV